MRKTFIYTLLSLLLLGMGLESCRSSQFKERKPRTLKKGKPIPCPVKDC